MKTTMTRTLWGLVAVMTVGSMGCDTAIHGEGGVYDETRSLSGFSAVETHGVNVQARIGLSWSVTVRSDDSILPYVRTSVEDGVLVISLEDGATYFPTTLEVEVMAPAFDALEQHGTADLMVEGLDTDYLHVSATGSGHTELSGTVDALLLESSGTGVRNAQDLLATEAEIISASSGAVWVTVTDTVTGNLSGPGDLNVFGDPKHRSVDADSSGTVVYY